MLADDGDGVVRMVGVEEENDGGGDDVVQSVAFGMEVAVVVQNGDVPHDGDALHDGDDGVRWNDGDSFRTAAKINVMMHSY